MNGGENMNICFVCDKEIRDNDETELFGCDGDKIHNSCKPNIDRKCELINNMTDDEFSQYMSGEY